MAMDTRNTIRTRVMYVFYVPVWWFVLLLARCVFLQHATFVYHTEQEYWTNAIPSHHISHAAAARSVYRLCYEWKPLRCLSFSTLADIRKARARQHQYWFLTIGSLLHSASLASCLLPYQLCQIKFAIPRRGVLYQFPNSSFMVYSLHCSATLRYSAHCLIASVGIVVLASFQLCVCGCVCDEFRECRNRVGATTHKIKQNWRSVTGRHTVEPKAQPDKTFQPNR